MSDQREEQPKTMSADTTGSEGIEHPTARITGPRIIPRVTASQLRKRRPKPRMIAICLLLYVSAAITGYLAYNYLF